MPLFLKFCSTLLFMSTRCFRTLNVNLLIKIVLRAKFSNNLIIVTFPWLIGLDHVRSNLLQCRVADSWSFSGGREISRTSGGYSILNKPFQSSCWFWGSTRNSAATTQHVSIAQLPKPDKFEFLTGIDVLFSKVLEITKHDDETVWQPLFCIQISSHVVKSFEMFLFFRVLERELNTRKESNYCFIIIFPNRS